MLPEVKVYSVVKQQQVSRKSWWTSVKYMNKVSELLALYFGSRQMPGMELLLFVSQSTEIDCQDLLFIAILEQ